jgi:plasmid stabilization system protein ParE
VGYRVVFVGDFFMDLDMVLAYYLDISTQVTDKFRIELRQSVQKIAHNPNRYSRIGFRNYRRALITGFPLKLIYRANHARREVAIVSIIHTARSGAYIRRKLGNV